MTRITGLASLLSVTLALSQAAPRLEVTPDDVLIDETFRIVLSGAPPRREVTIRMDADRGMWLSSATFRSDEQGRVEVPDATRFVWSAARGQTAPPARAGFATQRLVFTADIDGRPAATATLTRRVMPEGVRIVPVRERGLVATAYYPPGPRRRPAMIVLPGSTGGLPAPAAFPGGLASRGYVVLGLAYFNAEGLPPLLHNIPLEYFATAVDWLKSQTEVDPERIGVLGTSRGGELALLLGASYPSLFRVIVANVPSSVVWPGLSDDSATPAWTLAGKAIPHLPAQFNEVDLKVGGRERFLRRMQDVEAVRRAEIPVERIRAPLLMFSGKDDQLWPSDLFAERVVTRLQQHTFGYPVEHYSYDNAGHQITRPHVPTSGVRVVRPHPVSKRPNMAGGTPEGQARANEDSWARLLAFLEKYLK